MSTNRSLLRSLAGIALTIASVSYGIVSAQDTGSSADSGECLTYTAPGQSGSGDAVDVQNDNETQDDQAGDNQTDGETNDNQAGDNQNDGETQDDQAQAPSYTGTVTVDETALQGLANDAQCSKLTAMAKVTGDEAMAKAPAGSAVVKVGLDVENGYLVYSVELAGGSEIKVDAGDGSVLATNPAGTDGGDAEPTNGGEAPESTPAVQV